MTRAAAFVVDDGALADVASREGSVEVSRGVAVGSGVAVDVSQASVEVPQGALEDLRVELD
jgi:hypothetical protein